jgi:transcriptional regulator with XRE-family HTH domain
MRQAVLYAQVVGLVLRRARKKEGLKQGELAEAVGVTASVWSRIEAGQISLQVVHLDRACEALGVWGSELLDKAERLRERLDGEGGPVRVLTQAPPAEEASRWLMLDLRTLEKVALATAPEIIE